MRIRPALAASLLLICAPALADTEIRREEAASLRSYDLEDLAAKAHSLEGQLVRLKFNYRLATFQKEKDGSIKGRLMIWRYRPTATRTTLTSGSCEVTVPEEGIPWFMKVPTTESRGSLLVIARVEKSDESTGIPKATVLGREVKTDTKGSRIVW
jgi:ribosomal protein L29